MADTPTYKSTLTGPELDEVLRNIGKVQDNIEKAAGYAETAEQYGTIVEQNQTAIQVIQDNLPAVQGAAANAQSAAANAQAAAQSAQEAQTAAQQALGFRTFFSAVSPDENGDLDPSRPMTTPSAQASWTIKSKGDRIQSVQVNGFTEQSGIGDPSPTNVRAISTAGIWMLEALFDGSGDEYWTAFGGAPGAFFTDVQLPSATDPFNGYASRLIFYNGGNISQLPQNSYAIQRPIGKIRFIIRVNNTTTNVSDFRAYLSENPVVLWVGVDDKADATGLYIPIQVQGHEYRCKMLKLAEGLDAGDNVQSNVPIPCDKRVVLDGTQSLSQGNTASGWYQVFYNPGDSAKVPNGDDVFAYSEWLPALPINYTFQNKVSGISQRVDGLIALSFSLSDYPTCDSVAGVTEYLQAHPLPVYYQSAAYTEANDLFVELETHANGHTYAHNPVTLVAVPYTDSDVTAANQLAATPSTLPYIDSADVPMLLDESAEAEHVAQPMTMAAPLASALPVAGTYVVSSQDGTTVLVSLKAMQDGGDAATLGGVPSSGFATAAQGQLAQTAVQSILTAGVGPVANKELQKIDLMQINTQDYNGPENLPFFFGSNDPSADLINSPYSTGPFYGYRQTFFSRFPSSNSPHLITVVIFETYPMAGRIWGNTYDTTQSKWIGWHGTSMV